MEDLYFYRTNEVPYGCFSNFSKHRIIVEGKEWSTTEHYFQAKKFEGTKYEEIVRKASTAAKAAKEGRRRDYPLRKDWEEVKEDIMYTALKAKFSQHLELNKLLIETGERQIIEKTTTDYYWGCGTNKTGRNRLGILLMKLREELKKE